MINPNLGKKLGKALKNEREKKEFTQDELASKADITLRMLQKYEAGDRRPNYENLFQICKALDLDPAVVIKLMFEQWKKDL